MQPDTFEELTKQFREAQTNIIGCLNQLNSLNEAYINKQQKQFMNTFLLVMDRMGNQLRKSQEQYENIDKEIKTDYRCVALQKQLDFLHNQSFHLHQELLSKQKQMALANNKNRNLKERKQILNRNLFTQIKYLQKYRSISQRNHKPSLNSLLNKSYELAHNKSRSKSKEMNQDYIVTPFQMSDERRLNLNHFKFKSVNKKIDIEENNPLLKLDKSSKTRDSMRATQRQTKAIKFLSIDNSSKL